MPRGDNHPFTSEQRSIIGRQGGIVSGKVKRDRILEEYMKIVREKGVYEALIVCRDRSWRHGYDARKKWEMRQG